MFNEKRKRLQVTNVLDFKSLYLLVAVKLKIKTMSKMKGMRLQVTKDLDY